MHTCYCRRSWIVILNPLSDSKQVVSLGLGIWNKTEKTRKAPLELEPPIGLAQFCGGDMEYHTERFASFHLIVNPNKLCPYL